jgi:Flp pilus assembly protein TadG
MRSRWGARRHGRGQALVEFALVFPIFMLMVFGIIDLGRYVYVTNAFNQAAREAARYGSVEQWQYGCPASVSGPNRLTCTQQVAADRMAGAPAIFTVTATCTKSDASLTLESAASCRATDLLTVVVQTPSSPASQAFHLFTPILGSLVGPIVITGESQVVIQ